MMEKFIKTYRPREVAEMLNCDIKTVYALIAKSKLKAAKIGRAYRVSAESLNNLFEQSTNE